MKGLRLSIGMHLLYGGREHVIEQRLPSGEIQLRDVATNEFRSHPESNLVENLFDGKIELVGESREHARLQLKQAQTRVADFTALADDDKRKIKTRRRLAYVKGVADAGLTVFTDEHLAPVIERVSREIPDPASPSCSTVRRWFKAYELAGEDVRALVPASRAQGNRERKIGTDKANCAAVLKIIDEVINEEYLSLQRPKVADIYETIDSRIAGDNEHRRDDDKLVLPHQSTVYRIVGRLDPYERDLARWGRRIADSKHKANKHGPRPTRPLERVECDDTKSDLFVVDSASMMPLGRPWLVSAIDVYTKMLLGFFLSFVPPGYLTAMQCLMHAIRPKTYVKTKYPEVVCTWDALGIPETVVVDNAKHWYSAGFDDACLQLGMVVQYAPPRIPWYKAAIERFFGTLNRRLLHRLPGTTFSGVIEKGDYDPRENAVITLDLLEQLLHKWIIDVYHQSRHRGTGDVPARLWTIGVERFPPALPPKHTELEVLLGYVAERVVSASGVEMVGLYYNDDQLVPIRSGLKKGDKVKIKYDPTDLGMIYVLDARNGRYLPIPAVDQEYACGLSMWQHIIIKKRARRETDSYVDITHLREAKDHIKSRVKTYVDALSGNATSTKAARWLADDRRGGRGSLEIVGPERLREVDRGGDEGSDMVLLNPGAASLNDLNGISDFGDTRLLASGAGAGEADSVDDSPTTLGHIETITARTGKSRPKRTRNRREVEQPQTKSAEPSVVSASLSVDDGEYLDMTGWSTDYELPR